MMCSLICGEVRAIRRAVQSLLPVPVPAALRHFRHQVDGRNTRSDYFERYIGEVLTIANSSLHVLAAGRRSDLNTRHLITNASEVTDA
jgi:hypothetical protein